MRRNGVELVSRVWEIFGAFSRVYVDLRIDRRR